MYIFFIICLFYHRVLQVHGSPDTEDAEDTEYDPRALLIHDKPTPDIYDVGREFFKNMVLSYNGVYNNNGVKGYSKPLVTSVHSSSDGRQLQGESTTTTTTTTISREAMWQDLTGNNIHRSANEIIDAILKNVKLIWLVYQVYKCVTTKDSDYEKAERCFAADKRTMYRLAIDLFEAATDLQYLGSNGSLDNYFYPAGADGKRQCFSKPSTYTSLFSWLLPLIGSILDELWLINPPGARHARKWRRYIIGASKGMYRRIAEHIGTYIAAIREYILSVQLETERKECQNGTDNYEECLWSLKKNFRDAKLSYNFHVQVKNLIGGIGEVIDRFVSVYGYYDSWRFCQANDPQPERADVVNGEFFMKHKDEIRAAYNGGVDFQSNLDTHINELHEYLKPLTNTIPKGLPDSDRANFVALHSTHCYEAFWMYFTNANRHRFDRQYFLHYHGDQITAGGKMLRSYPAWEALGMALYSGMKVWREFNKVFLVYRFDFNYKTGEIEKRDVKTGLAVATAGVLMNLPLALYMFGILEDGAEYEAGVKSGINSTYTASDKCEELEDTETTTTSTVP